MLQFGDTLVRTAYLLLKDQQAAEEVVQDTFITAFHKIDQLKDPTKIKSWLVQITINGCRSKQRKWSWKHLIPSMNTEREIDESSSFDPERHLLQSDRINQLSQAIHQLDYKYREVITLYYFHGYSIQEIVNQMNVKGNTIKTRLARGRAHLKLILEKGGHDHE